MPDSCSGRTAAHSLSLALGMIAGAVATRSFAMLAAIGVFGALAMRFQRVPMRRVLIRLRGAAVVVGGVLVLSAFTSRDHALRNGASFAARVFDAALWATWLVSTRTPLQLDEGLAALGAPRGIVTLVALTRRFGAQLRSTMRSAWNATALRGGFRTPRTTAASVGAIAGILTVRALDRSYRAKLALDLRGGDGALFAHGARFSWTSWIALVAVVGALSIADRQWGAP
jgi:energy-coupling factor transporter transmembrane protein EcfT